MPCFTFAGAKRVRVAPTPNPSIIAELSLPFTLARSSNQSPILPYFSGNLLPAAVPIAVRMLLQEK